MSWVPGGLVVRFAGLPLYIHQSWLFIVVFMTWSLATSYFPWQYPAHSALLYWVMAGLVVLLLFGCVLVHELGHALVARLYGIPVMGITLFIFGGVAHLGGESRRPGVELKVALAGPLVSGAIVLVCLALARVIPETPAPAFVANGMARYLASVNIGLILFNLLPGFPLDGGRVLRALLWGAMKDYGRATRIACALGGWLGLGLMALGALRITQGSWSNGVWSIVLGLFLRDAARSSAHQGRPFTPS
jgi:Zn-dependent protease